MVDHIRELRVSDSYQREERGGEEREGRGRRVRERGGREKRRENEKDKFRKSSFLYIVHWDRTSQCWWKG